MGNGTKVALVALLILMVVVVAKFVKSDSDPEKDVAANAKTGADGAGAEKATEVARRDGRRTPAASNSLTSRNVSRTGDGTSATRRRSGPSATARDDDATRPTLPKRFPGPRFTRIDPRQPDATGATRQRSTGFEPLAPQEGTRPAAPPRASTKLDGDSLAYSGPPAGDRVVRTGFVPIDPETGRPSSPSPPLSERATAAATSRTAAAPEASGTAASTPTLPPVKKFESKYTAIGINREDDSEKASAEEPATEPPSSPKKATEATKFPVSYTLEKGDSPWKLAARFYGDGRLHPAIQKANPGKFLAGKKVVIPAPPAAPAVTPSNSPERRRSANPAPTARSDSSSRSSTKVAADGYYRVQKGDTLSALAQRFYGDAKKYHLIEEANPELEYTYLRAGQRIKIPPAR